MRRPYVALELVPALFCLVRSGDKRLTVREGHRDYQLNDTLYVLATNEIFDGEPGIYKTRINKLRHATLGELSEKELAADGFVNPGHALEVMQQFYPSITLESPVTVIGFE